MLLLVVSPYKFVERLDVVATFDSALSILRFFVVVGYSYKQYRRLREEIDKYEGGLEAFSRGYEKLGFLRR